MLEWVFDWIWFFKRIWYSYNFGWSFCYFITIFLLLWSGSTFPEVDPDPAKWSGSRSGFATMRKRIIIDSLFPSLVFNLPNKYYMILSILTKEHLWYCFIKNIWPVKFCYMVLFYNIIWYWIFWPKNIYDIVL